MHMNARLISGLMISTAIISTFATPAHALDQLELPSGGEVVAGAATIVNNGAGYLGINQTTDRAVINWDSFNIGENATTEFIQPGSNALAVNRVTGAGTDPTQILGNLRANGRIMVLDRNGVIFGKQARIDVGGIVASTGDVSNAQVMSGSDRIDIANTGSTGSVENQGTITVAEGGLAALVAPNVRNSGTINARLGRVGLASGDKVTVDLYGDNLIEMEVNGTAQKALVEQAGTINAEGGVVQISTKTAKGVVDNVINLDGVVNVASVTEKGGRIVLSGGTVNVSGKANASGRTGGSVRVDADKITTTSTASIAADSTAGEAAGRVDLIAAESAKFDGSISAVGAQGTGFVDTSAPELEFGDSITVSATDEWLIDPTNLNINGVLAAAMMLQLNLFGNMTLSTPNAGAQAGNITVNNNVIWVTNNSLTLNAHNNITFNAGGGLINTGAGNISLNAGNDITVAGNGIRSNGGNITLNADNNTLIAAYGLRSNGGDITVNSRRFRLNAGEVNANGGDVAINNWGGFQALANTIKTSGTGTINIRQNKDTNAFLSNNTVQGAINAISNSGTGTSRLHVGAGTWAESLVIDRSLQLLGRNAGIAGDAGRLPETIISTTGTAFTIKANNVHINGFKTDGANTAVSAVGYGSANITNNLFLNSKNNAVFLENSPNAWISRNAIIGTGQSAIVLRKAADSVISANALNNTGRSGVYVTESNGLVVDGNIIHTTGNNAIFVDTSSQIDVKNNYIGYLDKGITLAGSGNIKGDGIRVQGSYNSTGVKTLAVVGTGTSGQSFIRGNIVAGTSSLGFYSGNGIQVLGSSNVVVGGLGKGEANIISDTAWDGIHIQNAFDIDVLGNSVTNSARTGIFAGTTDGIIIASNTVDGTTSFHGIHVTASNDAEVSDNTISNTARDGVFVEGSDTVLVAANSISRVGDDGIHARNSNAIDITGNSVNIASTSGIHVDGATTGAVAISDNTVTDAPVGMLLEAGTIDLTGASNTLNGGNVGLRFNTPNVSLVGDTIGSTTFNGQATYYVELLNGALFAPGTPTLIDGLNASYDGFSPSLSGGVLTALELAALQDKIWDFNDDATLGLFFVGSVPLPPLALTFADEDAFNTFSAFAPPAGAVRLTVTGLPSIPGAPAPGAAPQPNDITNPDVLNTLSPAAGGEQPTQTEAAEVASIAPAAGGSQSASCWSDVTSMAGAGRQVDYNFSTDATAALADAASCGSTATP